VQIAMRPFRRIAVRRGVCSGLIPARFAKTRFFLFFLSPGMPRISMVWWGALLACLAVPCHAYFRGDPVLFPPSTSLSSRCCLCARRAQCLVNECAPIEYAYHKFCVVGCDAACMQVQTFKRMQYQGKRSVWSDVLVGQGPLFAVDRAVSLIYMSIHPSIYLSVYRSIYLYKHTYVHTYIRTYMHTYIHTCVHACIHTSIRLQLRLRYTHTSIHTYWIHTCIHTYIQLYVLSINLMTRASCSHHPLLNKCQTHRARKAIAQQGKASGGSRSVL
jgi:hypothetical protein